MTYSNYFRSFRKSFLPLLLFVLLVLLVCISTTSSSAQGNHQNEASTDDATPLIDWPNVEGENVTYTLFLDGKIFKEGLLESEYQIPDVSPLTLGRHTWYVVAYKDGEERAKTKELPIIIEERVEEKLLSPSNVKPEEESFMEKIAGMKKPAALVTQGFAVFSSLFVILEMRSLYNFLIALSNTLNRLYGVFRKRTKIYGVIREERTKNPLRAAIISFYDEARNLAGRCTSNKEGAYSYYLKPGRYRVEILGRMVRIAKEEDQSFTHEGYTVNIEKRGKMEMNFSPKTPTAVYRESKGEKIAVVLANIFFYTGWGLSIGVLIFFPSFLNAIVGIWYFVLYGIKRG